MPSTLTARPFNPQDYLTGGTYLDLLAGLVDTLDRWDEIDPVTALRLPVYFLEAERVGERLALQMFTPSSQADRPVEREAVIEAACDVIKRVAGDGHDAKRILRELGDAMRPEIERCLAPVTQQQRPSLLGRLLGR